MRVNELSHLLLALVVGVLLGVMGTMGIYNAVVSRYAEDEREAAEQALREAQEERDQALTQMNQMLEVEQRRRQGVDLGGGDEAAPPPRPAAAPAPRAEAPPKRADTAAASCAEAASPQAREAAPAPREQGAAAPAGPSQPPTPVFGPPRHTGD